MQPEQIAAALEAEVQTLRTAAAEAQREEAALIRERAAIDAERTDWNQRLATAEAKAEERGKVHSIERDAERAAWEAERAAEHEAWQREGDGWRREREAWQREREAWAAERQGLQERIARAEAATARALRSSPRHYAGVVWHRLTRAGGVRSDGRGPGSA